MPGPSKGHGGRPPKPIEQKRRNGNPGKRPLPDRVELVAVPPVDSAAVELTPLQALERALLAGAAWLAESDAAAIVLARDALELYAELRADPKAKVTDVISAGKWAQSCFADLGFNPSERSRLGLAEVKAQSVAESIIARRSARAAEVS